VSISTALRQLFDDVILDTLKLLFIRSVTSKELPYNVILLIKRFKISIRKLCKRSVLQVLASS
jgi:hypothetical protein